MKHQRIKLIVFDLWDTLAYHNADYSSTRKIFEIIHKNIVPKRFIKIFEQSVQTKKWKSKYAAFENLCKTLKIKPTKRLINLMIRIRDKVEIKPKLYPFTLSMLRQLKNKGYKTGLLSNSTIFSIKEIKKKTRLMEHIDYSLFSYDVGTIKPDTKMFKVMLKRAKCKPSEALMIGDTYEDDIVSAKQIGMNAIHFKNYKKLRKEMKKFSIALE